MWFQGWPRLYVLLEHCRHSCLNTWVISINQIVCHSNKRFWLQRHNHLTRVVLTLMYCILSAPSELDIDRFHFKPSVHCTGALITNHPLLLLKNIRYAGCSERNRQVANATDGHHSMGQTSTEIVIQFGSRSHIHVYTFDCMTLHHITKKGN